MNVLHDLPIREGINLAGSICSIIAVIMTLSITLNIVQWFIVILGFTFGVCVFGLLLSCVRYSKSNYRWLQPMANNPFGLVLLWALSILASLFLALVFGLLFGCGCYFFYMAVRDTFTGLPNVIR